MSQKGPLVEVAQSGSALQPTQTPRGWLHTVPPGHAPPSAQENTQVWLVGSQTCPPAQSPVTPHCTHCWSAESQRGRPGCVHCVSTTQATH